MALFASLIAGAQAQSTAYGSANVSLQFTNLPTWVNTSTSYSLLTSSLPFYAPAGQTSTITTDQASYANTTLSTYANPVWYGSLDGESIEQIVTTTITNPTNDVASIFWQETCEASTSITAGSLNDLSDASAQAYLEFTYDGNFNLLLADASSSSQGGFFTPYTSWSGVTDYADLGGGTTYYPNIFPQSFGSSFAIDNYADYFYLYPGQTMSIAEYSELSVSSYSSTPSPAAAIPFFAGLLIRRRTRRRNG